MGSSNVVIIGASSGLGAGMAREFARRGHDLGLCARRLDRLETLKAELEAAHPGIRIAVRTLDVTDHGQVFAVVRAFREDFGRLDRVVVNAGIGQGMPVGKGGFERNKAIIETKAILGAQSGITTSQRIRSGVTVWGTPARPIKEHLRSLALVGKLQQILDGLKELRGRIERLEAE